MNEKSGDQIQRESLDRLDRYATDEEAKAAAGRVTEKYAESLKRLAGSRPKRNYDSTVARMAGNIAGAWIAGETVIITEEVALQCVALARAIIAEVQRTEPVESGEAK